MIDNSKIHILYDEPIKKSSQDKFTYNSFVNVLVKLINSTLDEPNSFNIGLFGKWGVGKTSLIYLLQDAISNKSDLNDKVKIVIFNVWKYSDDSLRRQFLLETVDSIITSKERQKELKTNIKQRFLSEVKKEILSWKNILKIEIKPNVPTLISVIIALAIMLPFLVLGLATKNVPLWVSSIIMGMVMFILQEKVPELFQVNIPVQVDPKLVLPEDFSAEFQKIIEESVKEASGKLKKILFVFDDIDRCPENVIIEIMTMIKTYLNQDYCIYIIPCDDNGIKQHLIDNLKYDDNKADEFLKKFFQVSIRLPQPIEDDIYKFIHDCAKESDFPVEVEDVLIAAFWETPRRIKQFLNNLSLLREIAIEKETNHQLVIGEITNNLPLLTKIEVIKEKWLSLYNDIVKDGSLLKNLEDEHFGRKTVLSPEKKQVIQKHLESFELKNFLNATTRTITEDVSVFISLSQPEYVKQLPDASEFELEVITGNYEYTRSRLTDIDKGENYVKSILKIISKKIRNGHTSQAITALRILISDYSNLPANLQENIASDILQFINMPEISIRLNEFDINNIFKLILS